MDRSQAACALVLAAAVAFVACGGENPEGGLTASDGLVFVRLSDDSTEIMQARLSDGSVRALTETADRDETWPYWSDAAARVLFQVIPREGTDGDLWLLAPDTGAERRLFEAAQRNERWPVWAPDGRRLAFRWGKSGGGEGISVFDLDREVETVITDSPDFFRPQFAPDSVRLVAQRWVAGTRNSKLWLLQAGIPPRPLTTDDEWSDIKGFFARDGGLVIYSRRPADGGEFQLAAIDADGGKARSPLRAGKAGGHSARPSPTRDEIAFVSSRNGVDLDLYISSFPAGEPQSLTRTPKRNEFAPRWSPDGERIVVLTDTILTDAPRPRDGFGLDDPVLRVYDREGRLLFETPGMMADWMRPWP